MISLYDLLESSKGQLFGKPVAQLFNSFCLDVEKATSKQLFVVIRTDHGDSHRHTSRAIKQGVAGILCERPPECETDNVTVILVKDVVEALLSWTHYVLGKFGTKVIAVTGTIGKSTTIDVINRVLETRYRVFSDADGDGSPLSIPLAVSRLTIDHKFAILKLTATKAGEMAAMVQATQPEVGLITSIGDDCTDQFESPDQIAKEMEILVDYLSPNEFVVLNYDDDLVRSMSGNAHAQVGTIGMTNFGADMIAYNIINGLDGTKFDLRYGDNRYTNQHAPLSGNYHLYSMMAALTIGLRYDIPVDDALQTVSGVSSLSGRMNHLPGENGSLLIDDTYDATPQSTLDVLNWLQDIKTNYNRSFLIFGDMQDLGRHSRAGHRMVGTKAAEVVDVLITSGAESALTSKTALDHGADPDHVHTTYNIQDAVNILENEYELGQGDIILLKGGRDSRIEQITQTILKNRDDLENLVRGDSSTFRLSVKQPSHLNWIEIDAEALAGNVRAIKSLIGPNVSLAAIVKANGYGHGAVLAAQTAVLNGATHLGVSSLPEALELRDVGIIVPILVLNYIPVYMVHHAIRQNITLTLYDIEVARAYNRIAHGMGMKLSAHFKVDTGMGRLGALPGNAVRSFRHLVAMQNIEIDGLFTHFSVADEDPEYTAHQLTVFKDLLRSLRTTSGFRFKYVHAANSAATIAYPEAHFNMVRPGIALYGMHPSDTVRLPQGFKPVMTWKTIVMQAKTLPPGHTVGYGRTYTVGATTGTEETIAILPVGYAHGFRRTPKNWGEVLIRGKRAPIVGTVSMEKIAVNVSHIPDLAVGDEVVLLGRQGNDTITAEEVAKCLGTINYEVTCTALPGVPRT